MDAMALLKNVYILKLMVIFSVKKEFDSVFGAYGFFGRFYISLWGRGSDRIHGLDNVASALSKQRYQGPLSLAYIPRTLQPPMNRGAMLQKHKLFLLIGQQRTCRRQGP
jgi:hypothetical protein